MTDIIIIGGGPAGLSAAIYAKRAGFSVSVIDKGAADCQLTKAVEIENYLGFDSISGIDLQTKFIDHVKHNEIPIIKKAVVSVSKTENGFAVNTRRDSFECKYLILAMGRSHKKLGAEGEDRLSGAGVSYCATCDGYFFKDKTVAVVGGGDSALSQAVYLSAICEKVYLVHRRNTFRAARYLVDRVKSRNNIELLLDCSVKEIVGDMSVSGIKLLCNGEEKDISCDGVFCAVGEVPNMTFTVDGLELDERGLVLTDNFCKTNINGLYAVGDIRKKEVYQVITAVADGALALEGILREENGNM